MQNPPPKTPCAGNCAGISKSSPRKTLRFVKVLDSRKRPIRGLWQRGQRYYARMNVEGTDSRIALSAQSVPEARTELIKLLANKDAPALQRVQRGPAVADIVPIYLKHAALTKRPRTIELEQLHLKRFASKNGHIHLDKITRQSVVNYRAERLASGWCPRTCNLAVTVIRNLMNFAVDTGAVAALPFDHIPSLKHVPKRKRLYPWADIETLCTKAVEITRNGQKFSDYVKLMCFCGARRDETLRLQWGDVDWDRRQLIVGSDGLSKNHLSRAVDFSPKLEAHLRDMQGRRAESVEWLFVSPRTEDQRVRTFKQTLWIARDVVGPSDFAFHHCRVFFASQCVMAGIDFRTIAGWLGHQDGGVLLSKVYARLNDQHRRDMAAKLEIG